MTRIILLFVGLLCGVNCIQIGNGHNGMFQLDILEGLPFPFPAPFPLDILDLENERDECSCYERCKTSLSLENALLKIYITKAELNISSVEETIDDIDEVIQILKDAQDCIRKMDREPFFPIPFLKKPKPMKNLMYSIEIDHLISPNSEKSDVSSAPETEDTETTTLNEELTSFSPLESPKPSQTSQMEPVTEKQVDTKIDEQETDSKGTPVSVSDGSPSPIENVSTEPITQLKLEAKSNEQGTVSEAIVMPAPLGSPSSTEKVSTEPMTQLNLEAKSNEQETISKEVVTAPDPLQNFPPFLRAQLEPTIELDIGPKMAKQPFPDDKPTMWKSLLSQYSPENMGFLKEMNNEV